ncbi:MAG: trypsin-like serine protease [Acidimicrobiales bacterium]|nr:trypsin-like serine protease [Acidimicrobiales bacterium]
MSDTPAEQGENSEINNETQSQLWANSWNQGPNNFDNEQKNDGPSLGPSVNPPFQVPLASNPAEVANVRAPVQSQGFGSHYPQAAGYYGQQSYPQWNHQGGPYPYSNPGYGGFGGYPPHPGYPYGTPLPPFANQPGKSPKSVPTFVYIVIAAVCILIGVSAGVGASLYVNHSSPTYGGLNQTSPTTQNSGTPSSSLPTSLSAVNNGIVDVNTNLQYMQAQAAGTGIVLNSSGLILTNNHVIDAATQITVTDIGNGKTYSAKVIGFDKVDDVAVIQAQGASGLAVAPLGDSSKVATGDAVTALGNAGGVGGKPSVAKGSIIATDQSITASSDISNTSEQLTNMLKTNADIVPGDSGGPLVNSSGQVIGIDTAGSSGFQLQASNAAGFAIPINKAMGIESQIVKGQSSSKIHIGEMGFLGVSVENPTAGNAPSPSGAVIAGFLQNSPAQAAGMTVGDEITAVNGSSVSDTNSLSNIMLQFHPGNTITISYLTPAGATQSATVTLVVGPAA